MGLIQRLERLEQVAQQLPKTFEVASALVKGALGLLAALLILWILVGAGVFQTDGGLKAFGIELNWKAFQRQTAATAADANYVTVSELRGESGWVRAKCGDPDEQAISGACTIDPKSLGWVLQGAGIQDKQTWGCLFGRVAFVRDSDVPSDKDKPKDYVKLNPSELANALSVAPKTGRAAARVLCIKNKNKTE